MRIVKVVRRLVDRFYYVLASLVIMKLFKQFGH